MKSESLVFVYAAYSSLDRRHVAHEAPEADNCARVTASTAPRSAMLSLEQDGDSNSFIKVGRCSIANSGNLFENMFRLLRITLFGSEEICRSTVVVGNVSPSCAFGDGLGLASGFPSILSPVRAGEAPAGEPSCRAAARLSSFLWALILLALVRSTRGRVSWQFVSWDLWHREQGASPV